jgi:hypothetical protein
MPKARDSLIQLVLLILIKFAGSTSARGLSNLLRSYADYERVEFRDGKSSFVSIADEEDAGAQRDGQNSNRPWRRDLKDPGAEDLISEWAIDGRRFGFLWRDVWRQRSVLDPGRREHSRDLARWI